MGRRGASGFITRFKTGGMDFAMTAGFDFAATGALTTATGFGVDMTKGFSFIALGFIINFLFGFAFTADLDNILFTTFAFTAVVDLLFALGFALIFAFDLTFDFTTMTHILSWIIETPSASFLTINLLQSNKHFLR